MSMPSHTPEEQPLNKLEELQAALTLAQEAPPSLKPAVHVMQAVAPLLEEIQASLRESTTKIPHAASQLRSVSEAAELAATEILDFLDEASDEVNKMDAHHEARAQELAETATSTRLMQLLRTELGEEHTALLQKAEDIHAAHAELHAERQADLAATRRALNSISASMKAIRNTLQVQDITSQKISAVNHLIESIGERMSQFIDDEDVDTDSSPEMYPADKTFDSYARYDRSSERQEQADALIASFQDNTSDD